MRSVDVRWYCLSFTSRRIDHANITLEERRLLTREEALKIVDADLHPLSPSLPDPSIPQERHYHDRRRDGNWGRSNQQDAEILSLPMPRQHFVYEYPSQEVSDIHTHFNSKNMYNSLANGDTFQRKSLIPGIPSRNVPYRTFLEELGSRAIPYDRYSRVHKPYPQTRSLLRWHPFRAAGGSGTTDNKDGEEFELCLQAAFQYAGLFDAGRGSNCVANCLVHLLFLCDVVLQIVLLLHLQMNNRVVRECPLGCRRRISHNPDPAVLYRNKLHHHQRSHEVLLFVWWRSTPAKCLQEMVAPTVMQKRIQRILNTKNSFEREVKA
ncbi:unnamed protein product [Cyprideis torosa]|uniref:Uncharacterized protein n=1 Tax=Cyprideis torosa TaxID=163714 RepID=A0A7R8ZNU3_9CRUS|nr:unnamed protein product [Cyprideis torosa]CAG0888457.1 unnamed protein product [Cyprideis torosa]